MRFLADESCDFGVARALRTAGHDVRAVVELAPKTPAREVIALAVGEKRVVITEDKDFGQLVFAAGEGAVAVILLRYRAAARAAMGADVVRAIAGLGDSLFGCFVTLTPGRARVVKLPG